MIQNREIVSDEYAADIKAAALFVDMSFVDMSSEELCPGRRILSVEYALSAEAENDDGLEAQGIL